MEISWLFNQESIKRSEVALIWGYITTSFNQEVTQVPMPIDEKILPETTRLIELPDGNSELKIVMQLGSIDSYYVQRLFLIIDSFRNLVEAHDFVKAIEIAKKPFEVDQTPRTKCLKSIQ